MDKPEALRLADFLDDQYDPSHNLGEAADELRRLVVENERLVALNERLHQINPSHEMKLSVRGYEIQIADLKAANQELLEALQDLCDTLGECGMTERARAAIAKAKGEKA